MYGSTTDADFAVVIHILIGEVHREQRVIVRHRRTQEHGSVIPQPQFQPRQKPRALMIQSLDPEPDWSDIPVTIKDGKGFALLQYSGSIIRQ